MNIVQISDLHVQADGAEAAASVERLARCIQCVNALEPDAVLATGDLAHSGVLGEYHELRRQLNVLRAPYAVMPGNHDDIRMLRQAFADAAYLFECDTHASYAMTLGTLRVLALDSTKHRRPGGYLDDERLEWLQAQLRNSGDSPIVLALHHPPFHAGVVPLDWLGFRNLSRLARIVRGDTRIKRVISGHVHCARSAAWAGTTACTSPSIKPQRLVLWERGSAPRMHHEPAGFLLHRFRSTGEGETVVIRLQTQPEERRAPQALQRLGQDSIP